MGGSVSRFRNGADQIRFDGMLDGQLPSALHPHGVHHLSLENTVGPGKVNVLEDAESLRLLFRPGHYVDGADTVSGHLDDLAREHLADVLGTDRQETAGFRRHDPTFRLSTVVTVPIKS